MGRTQKAKMSKVSAVSSMTPQPSAAAKRSNEKLRKSEPPVKRKKLAQELDEEISDSEFDVQLDKLRSKQKQLKGKQFDDLKNVEDEDNLEGDNKDEEDSEDVDSDDEDVDSDDESDERDEESDNKDVDSDDGDDEDTDNEDDEDIDKDDDEVITNEDENSDEDSNSDHHMEHENNLEGDSKDKENIEDVDSDDEDVDYDDDDDETDEESDNKDFDSDDDDEDTDSENDEDIDKDDHEIITSEDEDSAEDSNDDRHMEREDTSAIKTVTKNQQQKAKLVSKKKQQKKEAEENIPIEATEMAQDLIATASRDKRTLFLKNLPKSVTADMIQSFSSDVLDVRIQFCRAKKSQNLKCAFVEFRDEGTAVKNKANFEQKKIDDQEISVDFVGEKSTFRPKKPQLPTSVDPKKLYVSGIRKDATVEDLEKLFPTASSVDFPRDKVDCPKGFAFIHFMDEGACKVAHATMQNHVISGRVLTVMYAKKLQSESKDSKKNKQGSRRRRKNKKSVAASDKEKENNEDRDNAERTEDNTDDDDD